MDDLRGWRVYEPCIRAFQREKRIPLEEIFLCEDVEGDDAHKRVYSCTSCKREKAQDPRKYDLFDGHTADGLAWRYESIGVGEPVPDPLASLTSDERLMLGVVKMADASFEPAYSSSGYMHFSSGAFLQPGDYHGLSTLLVRDPGDAAWTGTTEDHAASRARLRRALEYLLDDEHGNPIVRETMTCFEREVRSRVCARGSASDVWSWRPPHKTPLDPP